MREITRQDVEHFVSLWVWSYWGNVLLLAISKGSQAKQQHFSYTSSDPHFKLFGIMCSIDSFTYRHMLLDHFVRIPLNIHMCSHHQCSNTQHCLHRCWGHWHIHLLLLGINTITNNSHLMKMIVKY